MSGRKPVFLAAAGSCVALLIAVELLARLALPIVAGSELAYDFRALRVLAEQSRRTSKRVWLVGDSTVMGLDVQRSETPSVVLEQALRSSGVDVEVRAIAHPGIGLDNIGELLEGLPLQEGDVALVAIHLGLATTYLDTGVWRDGGAWQGRVEQWAGRGWQRSTLVRHADYVARIPVLLMQELLPRSVGYRLRRTRPGPERRQEWTGGALRPSDLQHLTEIYGQVGPAIAPEVGATLQRIRGDLSRRGVTLVSYVTPLNREIVEQYGYARWSELSSAARAACLRCASSELPCLNLIDTIPGELFYDDDHLMAEGYRALIRTLAPALESHL